MADDRFIDGLTAELRVAEAARLALAVRLHTVRDQLQSSARDAEAIHDLRVATRRAAAAIGVFRICIKGKAAKQAKSALKAIRRAAGLVRDWDVLVALDPPNELLRGYALGRREAALGEFNRMLDEVRSEALEVFDRLPRRVRRPKAEAIRRFRDLAPSFDSRLADFDKLLHKDARKPKAYHRLRIEAKRLRYSMEVFSPCLEPGFSERVYPQVEAMQQLLGEVQDANMAIERLEAVPKSMPTAEFVSRIQEQRTAAEAGFEVCREGWKADGNRP